MDNLRDLLGYILDWYDVMLLDHRWYRYCKFVSNVFSSKSTKVERVVQPVFEALMERRYDH